MNEEIKEYIDNAVSALVPGIIEGLQASMQPAQQVNTVVEEDDEISMDPCYQDAVIAKKEILKRIAEGKRSRTIIRGSKGGGQMVDNNLKDLDTINREIKNMRSSNHTQYFR